MHGTEAAIYYDSMWETFVGGLILWWNIKGSIMDVKDKQRKSTNNLALVRVRVETQLSNPNVQKKFQMMRKQHKRNSSNLPQLRLQTNNQTQQVNISRDCVSIILGWLLWANLLYCSIDVLLCSLCSILWGLVDVFCLQADAYRGT